MAKTAEYRLGEYTFPRGWFAVAQSNEVLRRPINVHYFGQDMVLYRGESGRVVMLDAYCPHMGTHLGRSTTSATVTSSAFLEGDNIRCPFHAWRFGPDGVCNHIPYHDGPIPAAARLRSWRVSERYGIVFAWHDPENLSADFDPPDYPEWDDPAWVRWEGLDHLADLNHPIEIFDNMSDVAHLSHLHGGAGVSRYENEVAGHILHQRESQTVTPQGEMLGGETRSMTTLAGYIGPGVAFGHFLEAYARQILCVTPIDDGSCRLWQASMIKAPADADATTARAHQVRFNGLMRSGLLKDVEIWKHKRPALQIMQLASDGPFWQSRAWYSQFYQPRAKAAEILKRVTGVHTAKGMPAFSATTH
jgi:3-ketosteroid 9alpha-monooxygenase subunit A